MSISFKNTIIHVLDLNMNMPLLSTGCLTLNDETESFITKHIIKIFESNATSIASFSETAAFRTQMEAPLDGESFMCLSNQLAETFYKYMVEYGTIPSGDLVITAFQMDGDSYLSLFKLNYKEEYTHFVEQENGLVTTGIIKYKSIFPPSSKQVEEGVIIDLDNFQVHLLDTSKSKYLALLFDLNPTLSVKETIKAMETVATKVIEEHYDNPINALSELKTNISESISRTQSIPIEEVMEQTFGKDAEVFESCMSEMAEYGIKEAKIEVTDTKLSNKYASQKIKTDTGIEIKFPTHLFKDPDFIEIVNNPNGTLSIVLKNISQIINK